MNATVKPSIKRAACAIVIAATLGQVGLAHAQDTAVRSETFGPNRALIRSGIVVFGLSYVPAFVVAATNPRPDDEYLYIPVAGPWLDLGNREQCRDCGNESLNKALLVTDGVFQGIGALEIVGSFLFMERTVRTTGTTKARNTASAPRTELTIRPTRVTGGYGIAALGRF